jgi:hypothetical protein
MPLAGGAEGEQDGGAGDPVVRGEPEGVAGVVVEPRQSLGRRAVTVSSMS